MARHIYISKLNTHFYDGQLEAVKVKINPELERIAAIPVESKLIRFTTLLIRLPVGSGRNNLVRIIRDFQLYGAHKGPNYDTKNNLATEDILYYYIEIMLQVDKEKQESLLNLLNTQLKEMSSGLCAQGRVCRLLQITLPAIELIS